MEETLSAGRMLGRLHRLIESSVEKQLKPYGINFPGLVILHRFYLTPGQSLPQRELRILLQTHKGSSSRALHKLADDGWLEQLPGPGDKRCTVWQLTEKSRRMQTTLGRILPGITAQLLHGFSPAEKEQLFSLLQRMTDNFATDRDGSTE